MDSSHSESLVAVFGGAGYIGSCLIRMLLGEGYRVRVIDNFLYGRSGISELHSPRLETIEADICDTRAVSHAMKGCDAVVLLSALVGHRVKDISRQGTRDINFLASNVVLDSAIEHGAQRFVFGSTNSVYGLQQGTMYETSIPEPVSLYSRLKLRMEERVLNSKTRNFHPTALRIATCHGYSPRMRFDLVVNGLVRDAMCNRKIKVQSGEQCRAFIHVNDAARAIVSCLEAHVNLVSGEIFNVGNSQQNVKIKEIIAIIKEQLPEVRVEIQEAEPDLPDYRLSNSKIEKLIDFSCERGLESSIAEMIDVFKEKRIDDPFSLKYYNT